MTEPSRRRAEGQGSTVRVLVGMVFTISAIMMSLIGFDRLITVLESGGYGTAPMRHALMILGAAGALLATGVATLIWEIAKRYESPGKPQVGDRKPAE